MENSQTLKGKEFIDFLLNFQQKEVESSVKRKMPKFCKNDLTSENAAKIRQIFKDDTAGDILHYFSAKNGLKVLVDSLEFN